MGAGTDRDILNRPDLVERDGARSGDRAAGFDHQPGRRQSDGGGLGVHNRRQFVGKVGYRRRIVVSHIGDPEATTEIDGGDLSGLVHSELGDDIAQQADHPPGGQLESAGVEDLRADVAVQTHQA